MLKTQEGYFLFVGVEQDKSGRYEGNVFFMFSYQ